MKFFRIFACFVVVSYVLSSMAFCANATENQVEQVEKRYTAATIDENFSDNEIIITVMPYANHYEYTIKDFEEIGCVEVEDLSLLANENGLG